MDVPTVRMDVLDVISWGETQIVAQLSEMDATQECEQLTYVIDLRANTVTLTDKLEKTTKRCAERWKSLEDTGTKLPTVSVFQLVHDYGSIYADRGINKYLSK